METKLKQDLALTKLMPSHIIAVIDKWIDKFPDAHKRGALIYALKIVQAENKGFLTDELISAVAEYFDLTKIAVYEVVSFYTGFEMKAVGKYKITLCSNISCSLCGASEIKEYLMNKLKINCGETTMDGKFTLREVECLAACGNAPVMQINEVYYGDLTIDMIDKILSNLK